MWAPALRMLLIASGLLAFFVSGLVSPLYRARPDLLQGELGVLAPPGLLGAASWAGAVLAALCLVERFLKAPHGAVPTYTPLIVLNVFWLTLLPGMPLATDASWWLVVDGRLWVLTLVIAAVLHRRLEPVALRSRLVYGLVVFTLVVALTPSRRFSQPYDERFGTGDEPRYVRIAASLLHDADAEIGNAEEHIGRPVAVGHFLAGAAGWVPAAFATAWEALVPGATRSSDSDRGPRYVGGPVIEGRDGGLYYAFLPGLPLLLAPAMAMDSYLDPTHLYATLFTCLVLGIVLVLMLARLAETLAPSRTAALALSLVLGLTLPLYFYHYQIYTEVAAAILVTVVLLVLRSELTPRRVLLFAAAVAYLPWLHGKYLPIWGVALAAFAWKAWKAKLDLRLFGLAIVVPSLGLASNCLYVFHITGSLMPDALWVLHGYERSGMLVSRTTLPGLDYLFLGRTEGLFVYAPHLVLALPGLWALAKRDAFAAVTGVALVVPYVLAAASHDQGGAGAWSPPGRYLVPVLPVFAMALAPWLSSPVRWAAFLVPATGSFWIARAMVSELNFPYDRPAFLASLVVDPSPLLESRILFPLMLVLGVGFVALAARRELSPARTALGLALGVVVMGSLVSLRVASPRRVARLRASPVALEIACEPLRLKAVSEPSAVRVRGAGFDRRLVVPAGVPARIEIPVRPVTRTSLSGTAEFHVVTLQVESGGPPVDADTRCR